MTITIDYDTALNLLQRAVNEKGEDYVYKRKEPFGSCMYFDENKQPDCIIGHVLSYLGITYDNLSTATLKGEDVNITAVNTLMYHKVIATDSVKTKTLLKKAQIYQDEGSTWGTALELAIEDAESDNPDD